MKYIFSSIFLSFFTITLFSQAQFESGTIVNSNNVSKNVLIKNEEWSKNPEKFHFKNSDISNVQIANLTNTNEIFVDGKFKFIKALVDIDLIGTSSNVSNYGKSKAPVFSQKEVFLNVLLEGEVSLLEYKEFDVSYFYLLLEDGKIIPLVYKRYISSKNGKILENNRFRNQLSNNLKSNKLGTEDFLGVEYYKSDLIAIFAEYYTAENTDYVLYENKKNLSSNHKVFTLRPELGVNFNTGSFGDPLKHIEDITFDTEISPIIAVEFEYYLPFNANKWSLFSEIAYSNYKNSVLKQREDTSFEDVDKITIDYSYFNFKIGPRNYIYLSEKSALYLEASLTLNLPLGDSGVFQEPYIESPSDIQPYTIEAKTLLSANLGFGFLYQDYNVEFGYTIPSSISSRQLIHTLSKYGNFSIKLGYRIFSTYE